MKPPIPFNRPYTDDREVQAAAAVLRSGVLRGDGYASKRVQELLRQDTGARFAFFTTSCTHALEIAILTLDIKPGDEVIMPSFTFVSTANAVVLQGGVPVFADILPGTLNLDMEDVERKISARTKAIIPVHYAGVSVDMDALLNISSNYGIKIIEDAAQGVDAYYKNQHLGTLGDIGCLSFHDTKNITCGEGGAFLTNDEEIARKAEIIREKGTNRSAFLRGEVDKYTWINRGSSYIQSDILAGILEAQWAKREEIRRLRKKVWMEYHNILEPFEHARWLSRPEIPDYARSNYHTYFITTRREEDRDPLLDALKNAGILATFHYVPLHSSPFGRSICETSSELPQTDKLSNSLIRLPIYPGLHETHPDFAKRVVTVLRTFFTQVKK